MPGSRIIRVAVDTREQKPFLFPKIAAIGGLGRKIETVSTRLETGDYAIIGHLDKVVVERKGSISEIYQNMVTVKDRRRQLAAFDRLAEMEFPILAVEKTVGSLLRPTKYAPVPGRAMDALFEAIMKRGIHLWFVGACGMPAHRRNVGELLVRAMVTWLEKPDHGELS